MSTSVTFNGTSYSIPASGETGWSALSSFLIDVANNAQTLAAQKGAIRIATSSPITISSTDYTVLSNLTVPGAVAVTLPVGVDKTIYVIGDTKGDAQTNNITITPNSGNINGSATYVIKNNYGVVALQYCTAATEWKIIGRYFTKIDAANEMFGLLGPANGGTGVANNAASTLTISGSYATTLTVTGATGVTLPTTGTLATLAGSEVLTNKTLTGNIAVTLVSGAATVTLPTTTSTLATLGLAETFTGAKTFGSAGAVGKLKVAGTTSGSTILDATATASGTLTLPAATDTLVGKATTDTLTNKTLTGNTAVNLISGSGTLTLNTSGTVTLPNATDTLVGKATTDVLTNKTLTGNTAVNLISGSGTLTLNTSGTMTLPNATDTVVGKATTDVFTNKTLSGNTAVTLISGSGTLTLNTSGTITVPNGTDTLVGKATTDTLTNKTLTSPVMTSPTLGAASATSLTVSGLTASTALVTDGSKVITSSATTATELGYVSGVTSAIQTQLNGKASVASAQDAPADAKNYTLTAAVGSSALTIALKSKAGTDPTGGDPVNISFRNATAATGDYTVVTVSAALSVVISSGSTLGHASTIPTYFYVYALNNAGTVELAVSTKLFDEGSVQTTTAEGGAGAADSATAIYSTTARTGKAIRLLARMYSTQTTAGTWASVPTEISLGTIKAPTIKEIYFANTSSALGGTDTSVPRFSNAITNTTGTMVTVVANDATNGTKITANRRCRVYVTQNMRSSVAATGHGITINASVGSATIDDGTNNSNIRAYAGCQATGSPSCVSWSGIMEVGDILRPMVGSSWSLTGGTFNQTFHLTVEPAD